MHAHYDYSFNLSSTFRKPRQRNYAFEKSKLTSDRKNTTSHPLGDLVKPTIKAITQKKPVTKRKPSTTPNSDPLGGGTDPLSMITSSHDPLSVLAVGGNESGSFSKARSSSIEQKADRETGIPLWSDLKSNILAKYTTSEKLSITTSFLSSRGGDVVKTVRQSPATVSDKMKNRLEQLDDFEEGSVKEMLNLSQQDYVKRIDELNKALITAWDQDQKVKALKIAIQCAKMLADTSVMQFYPSKFVLVTEILDTFGKLVYNRIFEKSTYKPAGSTKSVQLPADFTPDQVPESAKETCRNWFFKISSVRELIPRFYVEAAILKCYSFFKPSEMSDALSRLAVMVRGIGNPLIAAYSRCYLCRVGIIINPRQKDYIKKCFGDTLLTYHQIQSPSVTQGVTKQNISMSVYLTLYSPAVDWILMCMFDDCDDVLFDDILKQVNQSANSALLLNGILRSAKPQSIAKKAVIFIVLIRECEDTGFPKRILYNSLGSRLSLADPPESDKLKILNEVWKFITKLKEPSEYVACAETWIEYVMKHFGKKEMNTVLSDIIKHLLPDRAFEEFYPNLLTIMAKILDHVHNYALLFSLEKFMSFVDLFQKDSIKIKAAKIIVEAFCKYQLESVNDPVVISTVMYMCKTLHDSVNALSLDDEKRSVSQLINQFIHKVDYGSNFEQQLNFYVDSRANFTNLDPVMTELVQCVNNLSITTRKVVRGNHSPKTSAFVRACSAYCFITIPSLDNTFIQLNLYLLSAQVSLLNRCLSQAEALFKAGIAALLETPSTMTVDGKAKSSEGFVVQYIQNFLSSLVIVPDNPDQGVLILFKGLLNVIRGYQFDSGETVRVKLYLAVLSSLSAISQEKYLYHVDRVESNDTLYGHDAKFLGEVEKLSVTVVDEILNHLKTLTEGFENLKVQSHVSLLTFEHIVAYADLADEAMFQLAKNLWSLSQKHSYADSKQVTKVMTLLKRKAESNEHASKLMKKING
ncbi:C16orf62 [Bugula neritina]|uniref:C16orf62 n=1 Tax=Bugula neritina TaxID=10212 RepID=A0A7J7JYR5_BUGNE|nr:C16orf62 [Bugula neritina]